MQKQIFSFVFLAIISFALAAPSIVVEEIDQLNELTSLRQRREAQQGFGAGGGTRHSQGGYAGVNNPNGSGGSLSYGHANGYGHTVGADARVPVYSNKNRYGESTVNLGVGATQHFGGPGGSQNLDKRVGLSVNHRF